MGCRSASLEMTSCEQRTTSLQKLIRQLKPTRRSLISWVSLCCINDWSLDRNVGTNAILGSRNGRLTCVCDKDS